MADFTTADTDCLRYAKAPIEQSIVAVESSFNPFAIGVVGGVLQRQPRSKTEAIATALALKTRGYNFSMGCRQINQANLVRFGLDLGSAFDPLKNSMAGSAIYDECHARALVRFGDGDIATRAALSCYYSGDFTRGQQQEGPSPSYADKVLRNLPGGAAPGVALAIPLVTSSVRQRMHALSDKAALSEKAASAVAQLPDKKRPESWDVFQDF